MHLSLLEHGVYNQLLDWYYLDEQPLSTDNRTLFRRLSAKSDDEQKAVIDVLTEMFDQTEKGWVHRRVEREITQYKAKADQARAAGKLGGRPLKKGVGFSDNRDGYLKEPDAKPTANREPLTINQEPKKKKSAALESPDGVSQSVWADFLKLRAAKKAPMTATALKGIQREADKAGLTLSAALAVCCETGWQGFRADWYAARTHAKPGKPQAESFAAQDLRAKREAWEVMTNRKWPEQDLPQERHDVIEAEASTIRRIA